MIDEEASGEKVRSEEVIEDKIEDKAIDEQVIEDRALIEGKTAIEDKAQVTEGRGTDRRTKIATKLERNQIVDLTEQTKKNQTDTKVEDLKTDKTADIPDNPETTTEAIKLKTTKTKMNTEAGPMIQKIMFKEIEKKILTEDQEDNNPEEVIIIKF